MWPFSKKEQVIVRIPQDPNAYPIRILDWQEREKICWNGRKRLGDFYRMTGGEDADLLVFKRILYHNQHFKSDIPYNEFIYLPTSDEIAKSKTDMGCFGIWMWSRLHDWKFPPDDIGIVISGDHMFCVCHKHSPWFANSETYFNKVMKFQDYKTPDIWSKAIGFNLTSWWKYGVE